MKVRLLSCWLGLVMLLLLSILAVPVQAAPIYVLDFNIVAPTPGTINYSTLGGSLVGSGIEVDNVVGTPTPINSGPPPLPISNGVLTFSTGPLTGTTALTWNFAGGAGTSVSIVGGIPALGLVDGTTLMSGTLGPATVIDTGSLNYKVTVTSVFDYKNAALVGYYGLPNGTVPYTGAMNLQFQVSATPPNTWTMGAGDQVLSGDVTNTPVPEPGTLLLLGSGLAGLAGYTRLRFSRRKKT